MGKLITVLLTAAIGFAASAGGALADTSYEFADWTDVSGGVAHGTFHGGSVSLSGTEVDSPPAGTVNGDGRLWNRPDFTPPLPQSDAISFVGGAAHAYELDFGTPQTDPILDFGSVASTLTFPAGTQIDRLSGDAQFSVAGNQVIGAFEGPTDDGNGTVRLHGTFTSIPFTADFTGTDGIYLQVGIALPPPEPDTTITSGPSGPIWNAITQFTFTATLAGSTFECAIDDASWTACDSPYVTQDLSSGPHRFWVRAISADGVPDSTPATQDFEIKQPEDLQEPSCIVNPVLLWVWDARSEIFGGPRSEASDQWACIVEAPAGPCPQYHVCKWATDRCPVGALCTVTTKAEWFDADSNINHGAMAAAKFGGPNRIVWDPYGDFVDPDYGGSQETYCGVHGGHYCTTTASWLALGPDDPWGGCAWNRGTLPVAQSFGAIQLGPDSARTLKCFVSMHVEPADAYAPVQEVGTYATVYIPVSGSLTYRPLPIPAFAAAKRQRPAIAPITITVAQPGKVRFKLRLNGAARRILARRHSLPVALHMTFTPTTGAAITNTTRLTLRSAAKRKRCPVHKPTRNLRRLKACHIVRHA
jgi:hypothetical protein